MSVTRRSLDETWRFLEQDGPMPRDALGKPLVPAKKPSYDDEELGFSFFRQLVEGADYSNCTLPRTYFGRSKLERVSFRKADLSQSRMCWTDFIECDFSGADLSDCDMRASVFSCCKFTGATLRGADLRRSSFRDSDFAGANMVGAIADEDETIDSLIDSLTEEQQASIDWHDDQGPEPPGG